MADEQSVIRHSRRYRRAAALDKLAGSEIEQIRSVKALTKSVEVSNDRYLYGLAATTRSGGAAAALPAQNAQAQIRWGDCSRTCSSSKPSEEAGTEGPAGTAVHMRRPAARGLAEKKC